MMELIRNAWLGWHRFLDGGKLTTVLFLILLLFWWQGWKKNQSLLLTYTLAMAVMCVVPFSAAVFMLYQTKFYDYEWIWSAVPLVLVTAYGLTELGIPFCREKIKSNGQRLFFLSMMLAVGFLCGRMGNPKWTVQDISKDREEARLVLDSVVADSKGEICLWAPECIMTYARGLRGDISLLYGRNMWDKSLNAYSYDTYMEQQIECYVWMDYVQATGEFDKRDIQGVSCVESAVALGANRIILPGNIEPEAIKILQEQLHTQAQRIEEYYLFSLEET